MNKTTIYLLIFTLIVLGGWVAFGFYHSSQKTTLPPIVQEQIEPLNPNLPNQFWDELSKRQSRRVGNRLNY